MTETTSAHSTCQTPTPRRRERSHRTLAAWFFASLFLVAIAVSIGAAGCASPRKSDIPESRFQSDAKLAEGRVVFMHNCNQCHVLGGPGLGPGINDKPLPA